MLNTEEHETFWIFKPTSLLTSTDLIPLTCMTLDQKMNAATRFLILLTLLLLLFNVNNTLIMFLSGLVIIILIYVVYYKIQMSTECYENVVVDDKSFRQSCYENDVDLNNLLSFKYTPPPIHNLRFNDPPPFIAPSHDLETWKESSLTQHSAINANKGGYSLKQSGYKSYNSSTACGINPPLYQCEDENLPYRTCTRDVEYKCNSSTVRPTSIRENIHDAKNKIPVYTVENFSNSIDTCEKKCKAGPGGVSHEKSNKNCVALPGDLIEHCGYNPDKGCAGMPHNQPMSINDYYPSLASYHKSLNTQIIDPSGIYTQTEINEPQMTNLGISFAQQFQPLQTIDDECGEKMIIRKDPRLYSNPQKIYDYGELTPDSIFDPRSGGYGDDRRTYIDSVSGQPRFYYDDLNAAREGNFVTRNKIDVYNFTNQVGIFDADVNDNTLEVVKSQAQDAFINNGNDFRTSLQESLMRKSNEMTRQRRLFPLRGDSRTRNMK